MSKTIYVPIGTREQLEGAGINPQLQDIKFKETKSTKFPKELSIKDDEFVALKDGYFCPEEVEDNLQEIASRIEINY